MSKTVILQYIMYQLEKVIRQKDYDYNLIFIVNNMPKKKNSHIVKVVLISEKLSQVQRNSLLDFTLFTREQLL